MRAQLLLERVAVAVLAGMASVTWLFVVLSAALA